MDTDYSCSVCGKVIQDGEPMVNLNVNVTELFPGVLKQIQPTNVKTFCIECSKKFSSRAYVPYKDKKDYYKHKGPFCMECHKRIEEGDIAWWVNVTSERLGSDEFEVEGEIPQLIFCEKCAKKYDFEKVGLIPKE